MGGDRLGLHQAVALDDAEDDDLAGRAPAALAFPSAAEGGFVAFEAALERPAQLLRMGHRRSDQPVEPFRRRAARHQREALAVDRHAPDEALDQFRLHAAVEAGGVPQRSQSPALPAAAAFQTAV